MVKEVILDQKAYHIAYMWDTSFKSDVKYRGSTPRGHWKLGDLSTEEESGIPRVAVKCVDMWRNTSGEGDSLVCN